MWKVALGIAVFLQAGATRADQAKAEESDEGAVHVECPPDSPGEDCTDPANTDPSCHVVTIAVSAGVQPVADPTFYTHYSMLRSSEEALGITTFLGNAATATDMRAGMGF